METALIVALLLVVTMPFLATALLVKSMGRANRVSPRVPTFAPTSWLLLPERPARLHRRLRRCAAMARSGAALHAGGAGRGLPTVPDLADEIERRACSVDTQVVLAARARGPERWSMLNALESEVAEVEALASRLVGLTTTWATVAAAGHQQPGGSRAIAERLDALEQAVREVDQLQAAPHPAFGEMGQPAASVRPLHRDRRRIV